MNITDIVTYRKQLRQLLHYNKHEYLEKTGEVSLCDAKMMIEMRNSLDSVRRFVKKFKINTESTGTRFLDNKIGHRKAIKSAPRVFSDDAIALMMDDVWEKLDDVTFVLEEYIDGFPMIARYFNGKIALATAEFTYSGFNISKIAPKIYNLPMHLSGAPTYFEMLGTCYMTFDTLEKYKAMTGTHFDSSADAVLHALSNPDIPEGWLKFYPSEILDMYDEQEFFLMPTQDDFFDFLVDNNADIPFHYTIIDATDYPHTLKDFKEFYHEASHPVLGFFVKINEFSARKRIEASHNRLLPGWSFVHYIPSHIAYSTVTAIKRTSAAPKNNVKRIEFTPVTVNGICLDFVLAFQSIAISEIYEGDPIGIALSRDNIPIIFTSKSIWYEPQK